MVVLNLFLGVTATTLTMQLPLNRSHCLVVGDFNARHISWDMSSGNRNGSGLHKALNNLDLYLSNLEDPILL